LLFIKHCQNEQIKDQEVGGAWGAQEAPEMLTKILVG
jgi:hypothetical protein